MQDVVPTIPEDEPEPAVIVDNSNVVPQQDAGEIVVAEAESKKETDNSVMVSASYLNNLTNYPNPFGERTTISFDLEEQAKVALSVYDISGKLIKMLTDEELLKGSQRFEFERQTLASGAYFVQATIAEQRYTRKMIIQ